MSTCEAPGVQGALLLLALVYVVLFLGSYVALVITGHPHEADAISEAGVILGMFGYFAFLARSR